MDQISKKIGIVDEPVSISSSPVMGRDDTRANESSALASLLIFSSPALLAQLKLDYHQTNDPLALSYTFHFGACPSPHSEDLTDRRRGRPWYVVIG
jgi:hypothetical protein